MLPLTTNQIRAALLLCVLAASGWTVRLYLAAGQQSCPAVFDPYPAARTALADVDSIRAWLESPVAINSADTGELQRLHGIGPELARRIVGERKSGGAYGSLDELARRVPGIGPATADGMTGKITFDLPEKSDNGSGR
jgi:hypothetical protein